ncbi:MAG: membrane protein insertion efficiency factor YidD [Candidatus Omnitrophica bacterium]|nr:membrane protein insertion efficiency factor YidD [Candidatus Omnitrophota bacterium]
MIRRIAIGLVTLYQGTLRTILPCSCRFQPSCSDYAKQAFIKYGFFKGVWCSFKRLARCHPFSGRSGYDPLQ